MSEVALRGHHLSQSRVQIRVSTLVVPQVVVYYVGLNHTVSPRGGSLCSPGQLPMTERGESNSHPCQQAAHCCATVRATHNHLDLPDRSSRLPLLSCRSSKQATACLDSCFCRQHNLLLRKELLAMQVKNVSAKTLSLKLVCKCIFDLHSSTVFGPIEP